MTLDPQAQTVLDLAETSDRPLLESLDPPEARIQYAEMVQAAADDPPAGVTTRELSIPVQDGQIPARLYRPEDQDGALPILVYFHGGGFVIGDRDTHDIPCRQLALSAGCLVVSADYRLAPEHPFPQPVEDAWAATLWIGENAPDFGGDPSRIAVGGDSAGGTLAAVVCHLAKGDDGPRLQYQLLIYPATELGCAMPSHETLGQGYRLTADLMAWFMDHYFSDGGDRDQVIASPLHATDFSGLPPALVLVAGYDPLVDEGIAYAQALAGAGVATDVMEYRGMIHGFITMGGLVDAAADAMLGCGAALREAFASV